MKIALWLIVALLAVLIAGQMVFVWADDDTPKTITVNKADWQKP